jgi:hypothetical protein
MNKQTLDQATKDKFVIGHTAKDFNAYWNWCKASRCPCISISNYGKGKGYGLKVDTLSVPTTLSNRDNELIYAAISMYKHDYWSGPGMEVVIVSGLTRNDAISLASMIVSEWITPTW